MLKGGVIMDVTDAAQAKVAENAGAVAVMALERVPADIRVQGGVARMSRSEKIGEIRRPCPFPSWPSVRIGHIAEARILEALEVDFIDESEVLTPADDEHHIDKHGFTVPFVCGCRNLGEALAPGRRGRGHDPHQGRGGHGRHRRGGAPPARRAARDQDADHPGRGRADGRGQGPRRAL
jgi:pyridoxal 5'-phosphate synthase pdxS subunit